MDKKEILRNEIDKKRRQKIRDFFDCRGVYRCQIGKTILGSEIDAYVLGSGARHVMYIGAHHALDALCENLLFAFIYDVCIDKNNKSIKGINREFLLQMFTFYVIPALNLDGIAISRGEGRDNILSERQRRICGGDFSCWQANARGVDLDRNYELGFFEYSKTQSKRGVYFSPSGFSGEYPESEPESAAVANLLRVTGPALVVSFGSAGQEISYLPDVPKARRLAERFAERTDYRVLNPSAEENRGTLSAYASSLGALSLTLKLGRGENPLPIYHAEPIYSAVFEELMLLPTRL